MKNTSIVDKTIFYLTFAKSKLNPKYLGHKNARDEIDEIISTIRKKKVGGNNEHT